MKKENEVTTILEGISSLDETGISGFILSGIKTLSSIPDKIFAAKILKFLTALEENKIKAEEFISKIREKEDWQKLGAEFLVVVDSLSSLDKSYFYGKICGAYCEGKINFNELLKLTELLQNISLEDLKNVLKNYKNFKHINHSNNPIDLERLYKCHFLILKKPVIDNLAMLSDVKKDFAQISSWVNELMLEVQKIEYEISDTGKLLLKVLLEL